MLREGLQWVPSRVHRPVGTVHIARHSLGIKSHHSKLVLQLKSLERKANPPSFVIAMMGPRASSKKAPTSNLHL